MNIDAYKTLTQSPKFTEWITQNPQYKLAHCFFLKDSKAKNDWHFGFIDEKSQELVNFIVHNTKIIQENHTELAKEPNQQVLPLDIKKVTITKEEAEDILLKVVEEQKQGGITTTIFLLQHIPMIGTVWNLTAVTLAWKTLNVKIDAQTGEVKLTSTKSLFDVKKSDKV